MTLDENNQPPVEPPQSPDPSPKLLEPVSRSEISLIQNSPIAKQIEQAPAASAWTVPEDLRAPWDWIDLVIFALLALGGTFLISVLLMFAFRTFGIGLTQLRRSATARSYFAVLNQIILSFALLGYLAIQTNLRAGASFWHAIGWRPLTTRQIPKTMAYLSLIGGGFLLSMLVEFASNFFRPKGKLPIEAFFQDRGSALLLMLMSVLLAPVFEETIFRGFIYPVIARSFGIMASVLITGIIFGLLHAAQLWGGWTQIALLIIVGIIFTYVRAVTRTVLASYLLHVSYNSFLFLAFLISSHWLRAMPRAR
jgi:membrane protease YdiL (CAAX protease family)